MDPFEPPRAPTRLDPLEVGASSRVVAAGTSCLVAGLTTAAAGVQLLAMVEFYWTLLGAVPWVFVGGGAVQIVLGTGFVRTRRGAVVGAAVVTTLLTLALLAWNVFAVFAGWYSLLGYLALPVQAGATLLVWVSVPQAWREAAARDAWLR